MGEDREGAIPSRTLKPTLSQSMELTGCGGKGVVMLGLLSVDMDWVVRLGRVEYL